MGCGWVADGGPEFCPQSCRRGKKSLRLGAAQIIEWLHSMQGALGSILTTLSKAPHTPVIPALRTWISEDQRARYPSYSSSSRLGWATWEPVLTTSSRLNWVWWYIPFIPEFRIQEAGRFQGIPDQLDLHNEFQKKKKVAVLWTVATSSVIVAHRLWQKDHEGITL